MHYGLHFSSFSRESLRVRLRPLLPLTPLRFSYLSGFQQQQLRRSFCEENTGGVGGVYPDAPGKSFYSVKNLGTMLIRINYVFYALQVNEVKYHVAKNFAYL